jgi:hypothetical protein
LSNPFRHDGRPGLDIGLLRNRKCRGLCVSELSFRQRDGLDKTWLSNSMKFRFRFSNTAQDLQVPRHVRSYQCGALSDITSWI